jgi:hypothetical protein
MQISKYRNLLLCICTHSLLGNSANFYSESLNQIEDSLRLFANDSIVAHYGIIYVVIIIMFSILAGIVLDSFSNDWLYAFLVATSTIGCIIGGVCLDMPLRKWVYISNDLFTHLQCRFGNRWTLMLGKNVIQIVAASSCFLAKPLNSIELLFFGRLLCGRFFC